MDKKLPDVRVDGTTYQRISIKTHLIQFGEDLTALLKKYVLPVTKKGDFVAISEKVVSVCQNNSRHISTVKTGWLARIIVKGVRKYPNDIGFSQPEKMQLAVETAGHFKILLAIILGSLGKAIGIRGIFWIVASKRVAEIDGFNPNAMDPYKEYAVLPPNEPEEVCESVAKELGIPTTIIDGNNINVKIISLSGDFPVSKKIARRTLLDNPMGQDDELTPFIIVRKK